MAVEDYFVATAIGSVGMMGVFIYLFHYSVTQKQPRIFSLAWIGGVFMVIMFFLATIQRGFQFGAVDNELAGLSLGVLQALLYMTYLLVAYVMFEACREIYNVVIGIVSGRSSYGKSDADR